jgi:hypothetical protein
MFCCDGDVVVNGDGVDLPKQTSQPTTSGGLSVENVDISKVVDVEKHTTVAEDRAVCNQCGVDGEQLAPSHRRR